MVICPLTQQGPTERLLLLPGQAQHRRRDCIGLSRPLSCLTSAQPLPLSVTALAWSLSGFRDFIFVMENPRMP